MRNRTPLFIGVVIIFFITLLFAISSGCATKEPTTNIVNINNASQVGVEKESNAQLTSNPAAIEKPIKDLSASEETTSAETETQAAPKVKPDIEIIHPVEETHWKENIGGIAKNIPSGYKLWIVVYSQELNQYYPYAEVTPKNDQWIIEPMTIGFSDDYYKKFDIIAVLADKSAQDIFIDYINTAIENEKNPYSQGLYLIPEGTKEYDRITLQRIGWGDNTVK